jgi:glycosyl transferase family 25
MNLDNTNTAVNTLVDMVYVLSVKTFSDRIAHIENEMHKHDISFQFMFSYDIPDLDEGMLDTTFSNSTLSLAQKSLVLKHSQAWRDAEKHNYQRVLIFEDDVILHKDFCLHFSEVMLAAKKLPADYLIFLGGADTKVPDEYLLSNETLVALPIATAEAYVTDLAAIKRRINWLNHNKVSLPADHLIRSIDKIGRGANYWSRRPIAEQGSVTGIFDSYLDSHRQKHSRFFNISRNRWNKFQRHVLRGWVAKLRKMFFFNR